MGDTMNDFIDFADITNQIYRREMDRTYEFNLMLVGLNGSGKSTLVKSLFRGLMKPITEDEEESRLNHYEDILVENGVRLRLHCTETSGFYQHNNKQYLDYIEDKLKSYFIDYHRRSSWNIKDGRVHCCIYLIPPYPKLRLQKEDIDCMKALHERVNLVPIISRADSVDPTKLLKFKENIICDLEKHGIKYFKFAYDPKEDEERSKAVKVEAERFPFAVIAADEPAMLDGNRKRWLRTTAAGQIDIWDKKLCDFGALAKLLVRHCMLDLIESTHAKHYSKIKAEILKEARNSNGKNLKVMGLDDREVKDVLHYVSILPKKKHFDSIPKKIFEPIGNKAH